MADETTSNQNFEQQGGGFDSGASGHELQGRVKVAASPAAAALRAFEDDHLGPDAVRIDGKIERGFGSPFAAMSDEDKRQYAALEKRIEAEQKLDEANAALSQAMVDHDAAVAAVEASTDADPVKQ